MAVRYTEEDSITWIAVTALLMIVAILYCLLRKSKQLGRSSATCVSSVNNGDDVYHSTDLSGCCTISGEENSLATLQLNSRQWLLAR